MKSKDKMDDIMAFLDSKFSKLDDKKKDKKSNKKVKPPIEELKQA